MFFQAFKELRILQQRLGDCYRKGNSVMRSGPFSEPPDSENQKLLSSSPSRKSALIQSSHPAGVRREIFLRFFSAKGVAKFGVKFWWNFLRSTFCRAWVSESENFTKISCPKRCEKRKISCRFHSAGSWR